MEIIKILGMSGVILIIITSSAFGCTRLEFEFKIFFGTVMKASQAYRLEEGRFPRSLTELEREGGILIDRPKRYSFSILGTQNSFFFFANVNPNLPHDQQYYSVRRNPKLWELLLDPFGGLSPCGYLKLVPLKSYVGALLYSENTLEGYSKFTKLICEARKPGVAKIKTPIWRDGKLNCAEDFAPIAPIDW